MTSQALVGEKEEKLVLINWPAEAPAELPEVVIHPGWRRIIRSAIFVECVPIRILVLEETTAMEVVRAAFRNDLDLRT